MEQHELVKRAIAAYFRNSEGLPAQPSNDSAVETIEDKEYVILRNVEGPLAVYRVRNDGKLKGLRRWPAGIE